MSPFWIDSHCHLDAAEFDGDRVGVMAAARQAGVTRIVIPAIGRSNFGRVAECAAQCPGGAYALGIHPLFTAQADESDIDVLRDAIEVALPDARFVAIGEIGLDFFVPALTSPDARARQEWFYTEQMKLAREFALPVLLHVRRAQDMILRQLRRIAVPGGIAHAFNGSRQQADMFVGLGFKLGFGGAMTFTRALQIRQRATEMPPSALVLETDAPDIPPDWLMRGQASVRNTPAELPRIAAVLAQLRGWSIEDTAGITSANVAAVLPRLDLSEVLSSV